jgi:hypothetical protein
MVHYELVACRNRRWMPDGVLDSKGEAIEKAHNLVNRDPLVSAVRVLMLEVAESGVTERPVCTVRAPSIRTADRSSEIAARVAVARARASRARRSWSGRSLAITATVVIAALGVLGVGLAMPKQPWAFNSPEAQKPHLLRNSFTGEFAR